MKKVFVVGTALNYADFIKDAALTSDMKEADIDANLTILSHSAEIASKIRIY